MEAQLGEHLAKACLERRVGIVPLGDARLQLLLLPYHVQFLHGLVHADGVFPVVAAGGPLAGILDGHRTVGLHALLPHLLLGATHLDERGVHVVHTLADAP